MNRFLSIVAVFAASIGAETSTMAQTSMIVVDGLKVVRFSYPDGDPVEHLIGSQLTSLSSGFGMVYGPDGNLYISSFDTNAVLGYNGQTGRPFDTENFVGQNAGGLSQPTGLAFNGNSLLVSSFATNSVKQFNSASGSYVKDLIVTGGALEGPWDLQVEQSKNLLWVCSLLNDKVLSYNLTTGAFQSEAAVQSGKSFDDPVGIHLDAEGNLYVSCANSSNIFKRNASGILSELVAPFANGLSGPKDMTTSPEGWLLVGDGSNDPVKGYSRVSGAYTGTFVFSSNRGGLGDGRVPLMFPDAQTCYADCDGNGSLNIDDFICFQTFFVLGC